MTTPILEHVFDQLLEAGATEITVVVGYGRNRVQAYFGSRYRNVPFTHVTQGEQLGTDHVLLTAASIVDGTIVVVNGNLIVESAIDRDIIEAYDGSAVATLGLLNRTDVGSYGGVILEGDEVAETVENLQDERIEAGATVRGTLSEETEVRS